MNFLNILFEHPVVTILSLCIICDAIVSIVQAIFN